MGGVTIGLDIASRVDFTALATVECVESTTDRVIHDVDHHKNPLAGCLPAPRCRYETVDTFMVRDAGRLERGLSFVQIGARVAKAVRRLNDRGVTPRLAADVTGIGAPALEI